MFSIVWGGYSFSSRRERRGWAGKIKGAELENCSSVCRFLCENETNHHWYILINIGMFRFSLLVLNQTYGSLRLCIYIYIQYALYVLNCCWHVCVTLKSNQKGTKEDILRYFTNLVTFLSCCQSFLSAMITANDNVVHRIRRAFMPTLWPQKLEGFSIQSYFLGFFF